jgi:hypothetical protein
MNNIRVLPHVLLIIGGVWIGDHSQAVTTKNYNSLTNLHTLKISLTTAHKISSRSAFTSRCLVTTLSWLLVHS